MEVELALFPPDAGAACGAQTARGNEPTGSGAAMRRKPPAGGAPAKGALLAEDVGLPGSSLDSSEARVESLPPKTIRVDNAADAVSGESRANGESFSEARVLLSPPLPSTTAEGG